MRNIIFWTAIAAGALMQVGIAAWASSHKSSLEAQAFSQIENVHSAPFQMMLNAKKLPNGDFEDFSSPPQRLRMSYFANDFCGSRWRIAVLEATSRRDFVPWHFSDAGRRSAW